VIEFALSSEKNIQKREKKRKYLNISRNLLYIVRNYGIISTDIIPAPVRFRPKGEKFL